MKVLLLFALVSLSVSCTSTVSKRIPASLSEIQGRSIPENSLIKTRSVSFAIKEQGVKLSESSSSTMEGPAGKYSAEIEGISSGEILSATGEQSVEYRDGDDPITHMRRPGKTKFKNIVLRKRYYGKSEWQKWYKEVLAGKVSRKSGSIIMHNDSGEEVRTNFTGAQAARWKAPELNSGSDEAVEEIEISFENIEFK